LRSRTVRLASTRGRRPPAPPSLSTSGHLLRRPLRLSSAPPLPSAGHLICNLVGHLFFTLTGRMYDMGHLLCTLVDQICVPDHLLVTLAGKICTFDNLLVTLARHLFFTNTLGISNNIDLLNILCDCFFPFSKMFLSVLDLEHVMLELFMFLSVE
jgi:hypothetical protein